MLAPFWFPSTPLKVESAQCRKHEHPSLVMHLCSGRSIISSLDLLRCSHSQIEKLQNEQLKLHSSLDTVKKISPESTAWLCPSACFRTSKGISPDQNRDHHQKFPMDLPHQQGSWGLVRLRAFKFSNNSTVPVEQ